MAQFNSLTDRVRQMLGGMPQTLSDIGNRVGSNISLMGKIPQAAQQFVQQPDKFNQTLSQNIKRPGLGAPLTVPSFIASNTIKATGSLLQKGIPSALKIGSYISPGLSAARMSGVYPQLNAPVKGSDVLNIAGLAGIPKVGANIIGGGIGTTFKVGENALMRKPLDQGLGEAYRQGYQFSSQLAPVEKLTSWIASPTIKALSNKFPVFNKVVNKLTPGEVKDFTTWVTESLKQGNKSGLAMSVFGALQDSKNGQETLKNIWDQYRMGFVFGAGGKAVGNLKPGVIDPLREKLKPMTLDQKVANQGGFVKLAPGEKPTLEQLKADIANQAKNKPNGFNPIEDIPGTRPGLRAEFDNAIARQDVETIQKLLPEVPEAYKKQVGKYLDPILNSPLRQEAKKYKSAEEFVSVMRSKHRPPDIEGGSPLHDLTSNGSFPNDIYSDKATRLYGDYGMAGEKEAIGIIQQFKGKPDAEVTIYRAINPNETSAIKGGDWVTISKDYAKQHGESNLERGFKIISKKVKAGDILNDGNSVLEWGYRPDGHTDLSQSQLTEIWNQANKGVASTSQPKTVRTIKVAGQSRTQQPISSPASGNVGTVAGASGGQTSQPILGTEPLNKSIPQRGFAESVQTNKKTPAEIKPELEKIRYEPISNAETMAQADKIIQTDELKALDFAKNNTDTTANSVSLKLIEKYLDQGRFSEANDLISAVAPRFTKAGQEIQILSTYGRLTPTGAIKYAQTLINQANKANPKLNLKLTEANTKIITEYANRVQSLPVGSRERIVATAQLMQKITDQVPPSIGQKIATIQTMMQLLNPKTAIRNIIGNTLFTGAENISDVFATGLDRITSIITGRRSKVLPSITAQGKGFIKGGKEGLEDAMLGIDTSGGVSSQFEIKGKTFTDPIFGSLEKALNIELRVPDRAAYTAAFEGSLNNQMRAAGVAKATSEMIEIAHADGLYRTFQDNSRLAQIFSGVKKTLNKIGTPDGKFGLGDFIIKYPKTPANILSRGLDYSPAGFVKGIYEGIRPFMTGQPFNQKQFVENLSRAMVGTGLISAGYILAKNGIISGKNDKDYDISSVKRTTGQGAFKLNVSALARFFQSGGQKQDDQNGDTLVSYDWAQPTSIQVAMGANSALGGNAEDMASIASDNLQAGVDTLTGQSMVKNLMDYAGGIKDKGFVGATQDMALNSATGFIPSVVRQTANVFDPLQRSTYAETPAGVAINKAKATIPFVRNTLEPKLDVFGKEMPNYEGSGLRRLFDIFVNPAFVTKIQENPAAKEVIDIYQRSGLTTQAPRVADSKIKINGQDVKVSPRQYTEYQRYIGTKTDETFNALMNDPLFRKSSDEEKAKLLQGILTDINSAAKIELFGNNPKSIPQDVKNIIKSSTNATDRMLTLTKEGNLKMAMGDIEYPKLTGNTELDKKLISSYQGKLTQKANEVVAMFEAGEITAAQAESELSKIIELKKKVSTKKAKKAPKITVRKLSAPKVAKSARIKIKIPKLKKPKTLKLKKYTVKLSK